MRERDRDRDGAPTIDRETLRAFRGDPVATDQASDDPGGFDTRLRLGTVLRVTGDGTETDLVVVRPVGRVGSHPVGYDAVPADDPAGDTHTLRLVEVAGEYRVDHVRPDGPTGAEFVDVEVVGHDQAALEAAAAAALSG